MGMRSADQNVSAMDEGVTMNISSSSSTALSVTAAVGGLLVLFTLLVGGPIACICYVAMHVKKLRKKAKHTRSLIFATQWRAHNPFQPHHHHHHHQRNDIHGQAPTFAHAPPLGALDAEEKVVEDEGIISHWPCFLHTAIPDDFNGVSTALFQSPPPIIIRPCGMPEVIRFNPGIGHKRQEQSVQCCCPLIVADSPSLSYFEITILGFNRERSLRSRLGAEVARQAEKEKPNNDETIQCIEEGTKADNQGVQCIYIEDKTKEASWDTTDGVSVTHLDHNMQGKAFQSVIEGTLAIGLAARPAPPFRLPGRDAISVALHSKSGRLFIDDLHVGQPFVAPPGWGKVGATVGCGYDISTKMVCFIVGGVGYNTNFAMPILSNSSTIDGDEQVAADLACNLFPTIGADCDVTIRVNLGQESFKFKPGSCSTFQQ